MIAFRPVSELTAEERWLATRFHTTCVPRMFRRDPVDPRRITAIFERDQQRACEACREEHDSGDEASDG